MSDLSEILTCSVCLGHLEKPKRLPCGHCFCLTCLEGVRSKTCPECRKEFYGQPKNLPCDFKIQQLLDVLKKEEKSCLECQSNEKVEKCPHCPNSYCELCQLQHWRSICVIRRRLLRDSMYGFEKAGQLREHHRSVMIESLKNARRECRLLVDLHFKERLEQFERELYCPSPQPQLVNKFNKRFTKNPSSLSVAELRRFAQHLTGCTKEIEENCKEAVVQLEKVGDEVRQLEVIFPRPGMPKFSEPKVDEPMDGAAGTRRRAWTPTDRADILVDEIMGVHSFLIRPANTKSKPPMVYLHQSITCMNIYQDHSLEELRWEDYRIDRPVRAAQKPKFPLEPLIFPSSTILFETVHFEGLTKETQTESVHLLPKTRSSVFHEDMKNITERTKPPSFFMTDSEEEYGSTDGYTNLDLYLLSQKYPTVNSSRDENESEHKKENIIVNIEELRKHPLFESLAEEERTQSTAGLSNIMCSFGSKLFVWQGSTATLHRLDVISGKGHVSFRCNEPPLFSVSEITMNEEGNTVALHGPEGVACMWLEGDDFTTSDTFQCQGVTLSIFRHHMSSNVLKIVLQPDSYGKRMYVLLSDARFLVWDVMKNESIVETEVGQVTKEKRALDELPVSFDVVGNECDLYEDSAIRQVILLLENGNVISMDLKVDPKGVQLLGITKPLKVVPSGLELDFCIDAGTVLTLKEDIFVLATKSCLFYHCLLVWFGREKIVSVVEMFEIETEGCSSRKSIHLTRSLDGYLISHGSGIYEVTLPWINLPRDQLTERNLDGNKFRVAQLASEAAIGITEYFDGQVVYLSDSYRCRCPEKTIWIEPRITFQSEISQILEKPKMTLMPKIKNLDTDCSPEEAFRIGTDAIAALKENYVSRQEIALRKIAMKFATLQAERIRQQKDLVDLENLRTILTVNYDKLERRKSLAFFRYKQIIKRILNLFTTIHHFRTRADEEGQAQSAIEQELTASDRTKSSTSNEQISERERHESIDEKSGDKNRAISSRDPEPDIGGKKEATVDKNFESLYCENEEAKEDTKEEYHDSEANVKRLPERDRANPPIEAHTSFGTDHIVKAKEPESPSCDTEAASDAKDTDPDENEARLDTEQIDVSHFEEGSSF